MVAGGKQFSGGQQFDSAVVEDNKRFPLLN
jgi:hypothetical protein